MTRPYVSRPEGEELPEEHAHSHAFHSEEEHLAEGELPRFDVEKHILLADAKLDEAWRVGGRGGHFPS